MADTEGKRQLPELEEPTRRAFMAALAVAGVTAPVVASAAADVCTMPLEDQIAHHMGEVARLLTESAPEGFDANGIMMHIENGKPDLFYATARSDYQVAFFKPKFWQGWRIHETKIAV